MSASFYFISLQCVLILWSASAAVAKSLSITAETITFYRMFIAFCALSVLFCAFKKNRSSFTNTSFLKTLLAGVFLSLHWFTFFKSIKSSNISVALICLASGPLLIKVLTVFHNWKKRDLFEYVLSCASFLAIVMIFKSEHSHHTGLVWGFLSALFLSIHTLITEDLCHKITGVSIMLVQMASGVLCLGVFMYLQSRNTQIFLFSQKDILGLLFLGLFCTTFAMLFHVKCLEKLGSFTVILCSNMEPVYGILIALWVYGSSEYMSPSFYIAVSILLLCLTFQWLRNKKLFESSQSLQKK